MSIVSQNNNLINDLNKNQGEAVCDKSRILLILAGAGSGKTKVLTHKVAWTIREGIASSSNCLLLTFTNKAAGEMKERIEKLTSEMPAFAGTFHSFCTKLLRIDGEKIGIPSNFLIYDQEDQKDLIKEIFEDLGIRKEEINPQAALSSISEAKNQGLSSNDYSTFATTHFQKNVFNVFKTYEMRLKEIGALDFDDLLTKTVFLLEQSSETLKKWQRRLTHIFVDEWQDTNKIQYTLIKMLVGKLGHLTVVGDASQCLLPQTKILTKDGEKQIKDIKPGDLVASSIGRGNSGFFEVLGTSKRKYEGKTIKIITKSGKKLTLTPNHVLFSKLVPSENIYHVYLMYRYDKGYRIGIAKGMRHEYYHNGKKAIVGIFSRGNQESADAMWILKTSKNKPEANYWEMLYSIKYGIPTLVFDTCGRQMKISQTQIDKFFSAIDTAKRASDLMKDKNLDYRFPHHRPKGISGYRQRDRQVIHLKFFEDKRISSTSPWCMHRLALNTTNKDLEKRVKKSGYYTRPGRKGTWRIEICRLSYEEIERIAEEISKLGNDLQISYEVFPTNGSKFYFQPASHLQPEMVVPINSNYEIIEDRIKSVSVNKYRGKIYDLEIDKTHNYIANGIVVHNSIYSWRGADYRNINYLKRDYPEIKVINLEQNYRSTQNILDAANSVISKNSGHPILNLWTENAVGEKITLYTARSGFDEASFIVNKILELVTNKNKKYSDMAVLYRTNAQSRVLEESMLHEGIPYILVGGVHFYNRKEVRDILAFIKFLTNSKDEVSKKRILKLGVRRFEKFQQIIPDISIKDSDTLTILDFVIEKIGYLDLYKKETEENIARMENIKELRSVAAEFSSVNDFLENVALVEAEQSEKGKIKRRDVGNAVTLMTLHSAKGLEYPVVFMVGMEEGLFPHSRSLMDISQLEEERRLCYVGITRAKEKLFLTYASRRLYFGEQSANPPSRFLVDIPENLINMTNELKYEGEDVVSETDFSGFDKILEKYLGKQEDPNE